MRIGADQYTLGHLDGVRGGALLDLVRAHGRVHDARKVVAARDAGRRRSAIVIPR